MDLRIDQIMTGCADGCYQVRAGGCVAASLHWADETGALADWQPFAYLPIEPNGVGVYHMEGRRAIPRGATHVLARALSADFAKVEESLAPIPIPRQDTDSEPLQRFLVMTDLHLSTKPWQVRKALAMGETYDAVLITGDMTNDGTREQLERFWNCVNEVIPEVPVFTVTGNHDYPGNPLPRIPRGICDYPALQQRLLARAEHMGIFCLRDDSGAYAAAIGDTQIIGLNAACHWRRFKFPDNGQPEWLERHLAGSGAKRHIILCHAPLRLHHPYRPKNGACYLSRDRALQQILDAKRTEGIFLSGHTHYSMNCREGCVEMTEGGWLYINAGSIRPSALKPDEPLQPECWTEGNVVELRIGTKYTEVTGISIKTGQKIARGHYWFSK